MFDFTYCSSYEFSTHSTCGVLLLLLSTMSKKLTTGCFSLQISDAFRRFGMGNKDTSLLLVQIHNQGEETLSQIAKNVQGEMVNLSRLQQLTDVTKIKKVSFSVSCHLYYYSSPVRKNYVLKIGPISTRTVSIRHQSSHKFFYAYIISPRPLNRSLFVFVLCFLRQKIKKNFALP